MTTPAVRRCKNHTKTVFIGRRPQVRGEGSRVLSLAALAIVDAERLIVDAKDARAAALNRDVAAALVRALALAGELCGEA